MSARSKASAAALAERLVSELAGPLGVEHRPVVVPDATGAAPVPATLAALAVIEAYTGAAMPAEEILGEWEAFAGWDRRPDAFRILRCADGWLAVTLSRDSDIELVPALVEHDIGSVDHWRAVADWLRDVRVADAAARTALLGLPAAAVPPHRPPERRPPVIVATGGRRRSTDTAPRVIDLTAMWAGPLCARLLGLAGANVIKVETPTRPDGARVGNPAFYEVLHAGHEERTLDFTTQRDELYELLTSADLVLDASRPRVMAQLGVDVEALIGSGVIWVGITAYGRAGADAMRVGFGSDVAAGAGLVTWVNGEPQRVGYAIADPLAGVYAAAAAAVALAGARGCLLDVSMHDTAVRAAAV